MSDFSIQLERAYDRKVLQTLEKHVRRVALVVDAELVRRTPVDTGLARSNWLPSLNSPETKVVELNGGSDIRSTLSSYDTKDTIFISNNLPYISRLNAGSSKQAPAGFVEDAIQVGKNTLK